MKYPPIFKILAYGDGSGGLQGFCFRDLTSVACVFEAPCRNGLPAFELTSLLISLSINREKRARLSSTASCPCTEANAYTLFETVV